MWVVGSVIVNLIGFSPIKKLKQKLFLLGRVLILTYSKQPILRRFFMVFGLDFFRNSILKMAHFSNQSEFRKKSICILFNPSA